MEEVEDKFSKKEKTRPKSMSLLMYQVDDLEATELDSPRTKCPTENTVSLISTTSPTSPKLQKCRAVMVEEIEDEALRAQREKQKSPTHLLESLDEGDITIEEALDENRSTLEEKEVHHTSAMPDQEHHSLPLTSLPASPPDLELIRLK